MARSGAGGSVDDIRWNKDPSGIEESVTVGDWAAGAITFGWAGTAFWVVHVITRPQPDGRPKPPTDD